MKNDLNLLKEKNFMKVIFANVITRLGDGIDTIAFSWLVYQVTGSTVLTATIYGVNVIPNLTIGLISGVICQYISEKVMMFICDIGRAICVFLIAFLFMNQQLEVWHLFVITFINSSFEAFRTPCEASIYPKVLKEENLDNGIAFKQSVVNGANFLGIAIAPLCITLFDLQGALLIDAISFALCGFITLTLRNIPITTQMRLTVSQCFQDLKDGFIYVRKDRFLLKTFIVISILNALFAPINSFQAAFVKDLLQMSSIGISIFTMGYLLGSVIFSPFLPRLKDSFGGRKLTVYGIVGVSILFVAYALLPMVSIELRYIVLALVSFLMGVTISTCNFPTQIVLYKRIDSEYLSRVQSIVFTIAMAVVPVSSFIAGGLSHFLPLQTIYLSCGGILIVLSILLVFDKIFYTFNEY